MPIHDQGYRRYGGDRSARGAAWIVIARAILRNVLANRKFLALLLAAWGQFVIRVAQIYASTNFPQVAFLAPTAQTFRDFLEFQDLFVFFLTIFVGAGLIANDRRANALQIYLSKPLTRFEYVAGKATALAALLLLVTWVPAILLLVVQILFAGSFAFVQKNAYLFPAITVYSFLEVLLATLAMLALSSMSKSARFVAIMYAGVMIFTNALYGVLRFAVRSDGASLISPTQSLAQLGDIIFRLEPRHATPGWLSVLALVLLMAASVVILERRVRGVEVVA
jgi:ABC-2 type transport system permease protein